MAPRCCSPPESWSGKCSRRWPGPTASRARAARVHGRVARPGDQQRHRQVLRKRELPEQAVELEHDSRCGGCAIAPGPASDSAPMSCPNSSTRTRVRLVEQAQEVQERALAHAGRTHQGQHLARDHLEVHAAHTSTRRSRAVALAQPPSRRDRHRARQAHPYRRPSHRRCAGATASAGRQGRRHCRQHARCQGPPPRHPHGSRHRNGTCETMNTPAGSGIAWVKSRIQATERAESGAREPTGAPPPRHRGRRNSRRRPGRPPAPSPAGARCRARFSAASSVEVTQQVERRHGHDEGHPEADHDALQGQGGQQRPVELRKGHDLHVIRQLALHERCHIPRQRPDQGTDLDRDGAGGPRISAPQLSGHPHARPVPRRGAGRR